MSVKSRKAVKPDATLHNPDPEYLRDLLLKAGITQAAAATAIGITERVLRYYLSDTQSATYRPAPYVVQYALEQLAPGAAIPLRSIDHQRLAAAEQRDSELVELLRDMRSGRSSLLVTFFDRIDAAIKPKAENQKVAP
jgi:transcriptional regulator with XRE-family HTH domain